MSDATAPPSHQGEVPPRRKGLPTWAIIVIIAGVFFVLSLFCVGLLGAVLFPALAKARDAAQRMVNQTHLSQIAIGLQVYSAQNQDFLPETDVGWEQRLMLDAGLTADVFVSPYASPDETSYYYVPGYNVATAEDPSTIIILYDNPDFVTDSGTVGYLDGHVEQLPAGEFMERIMGVTLPDGTPYRPHEGD